MNRIIKQAFEATVSAVIMMLLFLMSSGAKDIKIQLIVFLATFVPTFVLIGLWFKQKSEKK